jgi:hypothetical protein
MSLLSSRHFRNIPKTNYLKKIPRKQTINHQYKTINNKIINSNNTNNNTLTMEDNKFSIITLNNRNT